MNTKEFTAAVKAAGEADGLKPGQYRALVSVFGNADTYGDVVMPGAFTKDLQRWADSGDPLPVVWAHDWMDPYSHIGHVIKAEETDDGLEITAELDLDNPKADQVYRLLKGRRVTQHSFAYDIEEGGPATHDGEDVFELTELKLFEVGPCLVGVNQETELLAVKAAQLTKAGRSLSQKNLDKITAAHHALAEMIENATTQTPDPDNGDSEKTDEPSQAKASASDVHAASASAPRRTQAVAPKFEMYEERNDHAHIA